MFHKWQLLLLLAFAAAGDQSWKNKPIPEWSEDDARQVLSESPWVKTVTPAVNRPNNTARRPPIRMGRRGGIGRPGRGAGGYPGGRPNSEASQAPTLKLRWESALPVREALLKAHDDNAPTLDENHYALVVYGVSSRMADPSSQKLPDQLKKHAVLKRNGKKDLKPSGVRVLRQKDGPVIVYLFPRSKEITAEDGRVEFNAQIGQLKFSEYFTLDDMMWQGKLEL